MVSWPSGLGGSLQNYLHRFESCTDLMRTKEIDDLIRDMRKVVKKCSKDKKFAIKFLKSAGIIKKKNKRV